ncbi:hypothetical protein HPB51_027253 [Rhipicephalus microplus]|uniref:Uncharacterized protein n=1 Tax=Rhipicephalus microplus TaxID=6941 RepID=A0A9J6D0Q1_RHIMP|nr:hypothetical protein HPB51_027253 [Rhipicephalus microplus]
MWSSRPSRRCLPDTDEESVPRVCCERSRERSPMPTDMCYVRGATSNCRQVLPASIPSTLLAVNKSRSRSRGCSRSDRRAHSKKLSLTKERSHSRLRFREALKTWADRAKPSPAQQSAQVTHVPLPEQKEDPRIAFLLQENASLRTLLQQMRVEFEALRNTALAPVRSSSVELRWAERKISVEGEVVAASDLDVLRAIKDLQKTEARQAECFDLVACKVAMIESRLAPGGNSFVPVTPVSLVPSARPGTPRDQAPIDIDIPLSRQTSSSSVGSQCH